MTEAPAARFEMAKAYEPWKIEQKWYQYWMVKGYFTPPIDPAKKPFVIIMPPPNVTGELHLGHVMPATLEDIMVRWHRMKGEPTLWLPGVDHAGIAAQVVVERLLAKEGLTRQKLGRAKFVARMREWAASCRSRIAYQHQRLGASCDWKRERFTLDEGPSRAVRAAFVRLYNKGLIYRGERIISWCPRCATALSDLEVDHRDLAGSLWYVRYPLADGSGYITVATTRPETIVGDTAVAVNPNDERYKVLIGKNVILPAVRRQVPIVADDAVDPAFGTGAVKITPAHDPVDFEVARRHNLPFVNILNPDATMNDNAGPYAGMDRFAARQAIVDDLKKEGLLVKIEPYSHAVGHCQRCQTVIEPVASKQWFVNTPPLAQPAIAAVNDGRIKIIPDHFIKVYLNWTENIRDWCISRQLWWGHRIPAWYCGKCDGDRIYLRLTDDLYAKYGMAKTIYQYSVLRGCAPTFEEIVNGTEWAVIDEKAKPIVAENEPETCPVCGGKDLIPDPDVLDTWFSSALWTHSTLGWPDGTEDLRYFYPTSVMETGYDILFFWVARMIMMGIEDTGEIPFHTVYLHGLIRDEKGEKMSKVKGNVLNPIELLEKYGTDALRFAISTGTSPGNDIKMSPAKLEAGRNFANKLWNATRFILGNMPDGYRHDAPTETSERPLEDRWIVSRLNRTIASVASLVDDYQFGEAERQIYDFLWGDFCDWYIELSKIRLRVENKAAASPLPVLVNTLEAALRLLHPYMPFITEELWQSLKRRMPGGWRAEDSIMIAPYPEADARLFDSEAERVMEALIDIVRGVRNVRAQYNVEAGRWIEARVYAGELAPVLQKYAGAIENLAHARPVAFLAERPAHEEGTLAVVLKESEVFIPMASMLDIAAERQKLAREIEQNQAEAARLEARLNDAAFLSKAPPAVVQKERDKLAVIQDKLARLREQLARFK